MLKDMVLALLEDLESVRLKALDILEYLDCKEDKKSCEKITDVGDILENFVLRILSAFGSNGVDKVKK